MSATLSTTSDEFNIGDSVTWMSQWAKRDERGKMILYQGTLIDKAVDIPGWVVRRDDGKRLKVRTSIMRPFKQNPCAPCA